MTPSTVCWNPSAAPLRPVPAISAAAVNATPFQERLSTPATASVGTSTANGASTSKATAAVPAEMSRPRTRNGPTRDPTRSDHRPAAMRAADTEDVHRREHECGRVRREASVLMQEQHGIARQRDLCHDEEPRAHGEQPVAQVAERSRDLGRMDLRSRRRLPQEQRGNACADESPPRRGRGTPSQDRRSTQATGSRWLPRRRRSARRSDGSRARALAVPAPNQPMTARPLAALMLDPSAPKTHEEARRARRSSS